MFLEHGFDGARIADIAQRASVAEGTIYLYFRNKEALLHAVVSRFYERLTASARDGVRDLGGTREQLAFLARHHMSGCLAEWRIIELAMSIYRQVSAYESSGYRQFNKTYVAVFDDVIRDGVRRGDIRPDAPLRALRDLFYGALEYSCRTYLLGREAPPDAGDIERGAERVVDLIWRGAARRGEPRGTTGSSDLDAIARRLERVAARLES